MSYRVFYSVTSHYVVEVDEAESDEDAIAKALEMIAEGDDGYEIDTSEPTDLRAVKDEP